MEPLFNDPELQATFNQDGFVKIPLLNQSQMQALLQLYASLELSDELGLGYNVGMNCSIEEKRRKMQDTVNDLLFPIIQPILFNRKPYSASFMVKEPKQSGIVPAHQDWTFCDENRYDSFMVWIPLNDVNEINGALGFIKGSHHFFNYKRAFPFPMVQTPVEQYKRQLTPYLQIVEMKAGEAVFFNNKTIHGSLANESNEDRISVSLSMYPIDDQLVTYFLKPDNNGEKVLKYAVDDHFFVRYNNPIMLKAYKSGHLLEGFPLIEEESYDYLSEMSWPEMEQILHKNGHQKDLAKVAKVEAFYQQMLRY